MAYEQKGNSNYYYQKYRVGNQVNSKYIGKGAEAEIIAEEDENRRSVTIILRNIQKSKLEKEKEYDKLADLIYDRNTSVSKALLLINGYHTHKGQWRKKRV